jgi:Plasmid encoded RepA protein
MKELSITRQQSKLLDAASAIRLDPDKIEAAFIARQLVQATLPHKNPGDVPLWSRTNGNLTLTIQPGHEKGKLTGYPYGTIPRLLLFWITTEAARTKNPRLELGNHFASFMRQLGLDPATGRGKRGDAKRLRDQMQRLFKATISFEQTREENGRKGNAWLDMKVAPEGVLWWDERQPEQPTLWGSWIELSKQFFNAITAAPVPVDMRALKALKRSALALDLYSWATYTAYQTQKTGQSRSVSWAFLHKQFGAEYTEIRNFQTKSWAALRKIKTVYPELGIERERGGVKVLPCNPSVTIKAKRSKSVDEESY